MSPFVKVSSPRVLQNSNTKKPQLGTVANDAAIKGQRRTLRKFLHVPDSLDHFHVEFGESRVSGSCEWLTDTPEFRRWRDALEPRIFWLKGNPGTGKSFIANYAVYHLESLSYDCSYFFFRAGDKLHSSLTGCLLSLAWQMAETNASVRQQFLDMSDNGIQLDPESYQSIWRTLFVSGILQIKLARPHFWVLDGLDEFGGYRQLFPLLAKLNSASTIQIFLTSRPSLDAQSDFTDNGLSGVLFDLTRDKSLLDMKRYVESHADFPSIRGTSERAELLQTILDKSEGSFLWVKLVLRELRGALSVEATRKILKSVPQGMNSLYSRSLEVLARETSRKTAAEAILMWASICVRPLSTAELKEALFIHINQTFNNLENHISWLCGYLVTVNSSQKVKMVHETARSFLLEQNNGAVINVNEEDAHETLAIVCLKYLSSKELKMPRGRRAHTNQAATTADRSLFLNYAATSFHEHIQRSKSISDEILDLLYDFLVSKDGNLLTWIEYVAKTNRDLTVVTRAGTLLKNFCVRVGKNPMRRTTKLDAIQSWSTDLIRVVTKFGRNLIDSPSSIYTTIAPFCPRSSSLYRQYGRSPRAISVLGVPSLVDWDDCLATIVYRQKGNRAMSVAATGNYFAVGTSSPFLRLYHTSTCQEFAVLPHGEHVRIIELSLTGQWAVTGGNKHLCLWDVGSRALKWKLDLDRPCVALSFTSENDEVVMACQDNHLYYISLSTGAIEGKSQWFMDEDHSQVITSSVATAAMSFQHHLLAFVYRGGHIGIWDWEEEELVGFCEKPDARSRICPFHATSMVFSPIPTSNSLAAAYEQGEIIVFDPIEGCVQATYKGNTDNQTLACSPDGRTLISGDSSGVIRIFDFQNLDDPNQKMRLLYLISGIEENIGGLAFCDDKRFVDIRGPKVKVWEPTVLVRQDTAMSETESITSEQLLDQSPTAEEVDTITSLTIHPNGKDIFYATREGLICVCDVATGENIQTIYDQSWGDTIMWMIISQTEDILATGGVSSKLVVRRLVYNKPKWSIAATLFEFRMGEQIEQLLFNPSSTHILVVTTSCDMVYCLADSSTSKKSWDTRLPGVWCNDPQDPDRLLLWVNRKLRVFDWGGLREISPASGIALNFELPDRFGIQNVYTGGEAKVIATVYSEVQHARSHVRLLFWDIGSILGSDRNATSTEAEHLTPHSTLQTYGDSISELVGTLGMIVGVFGGRILFLDQDGWICTWHLDGPSAGSVLRHFFLPADWLSTDDTLLVSLTPKGEMLFGKGHELAIIKRALSMSQSG